MPQFLDRDEVLALMREYDVEGPLLDAMREMPCYTFNNGPVTGDSVPIERMTVRSGSCPAPSIYGGDEYKCCACKIIWGARDERPPCRKG